ncbi:MAG: hypothetical protein M3220_01150 [Chloroflexota bacterium]|nr:hypothetical protein [Chloroflexota bacterium]
MNSNLWSRLSGPVKVGLTFFLIAVVLSMVGILRNPDTPATMQTILIATVISGVTWGLISWAVATAVVDVEEDIEERDGGPLE